jgi:hypothetical protein
MATTAFEKIQAIKEEAEKKIEALKAEAISEIAKRRSVLLEQLKAVDEEYEQLTGKSVRGERVRKAGSDGTKTPKADVGDERELVDLLKKADGHKLNRKGFGDLGYNLRSAKVIAKSNEKLFKLDENGPQATITLLK